MPVSCASTPVESVKTPLAAPSHRPHPPSAESARDQTELSMVCDRITDDSPLSRLHFARPLGRLLRAVRIARRPHHSVIGATLGRTGTTHDRQTARGEVRCAL